MRKLRLGRRLALLVGICAGAVLGAAGIASAGGGSASQAVPSAITIKAKSINGKPFLLFAPNHPTISQGGTLTIRNASPAPHTFSLVRQSLLPKTKRQRQLCFAPGHICYQIAARHTGGNPSGPLSVNPTEAGQPGWDTEGGIHKRGDSIYFSRNRPRALPVSAPAGTTLHFMCIIHPWMQGTITVR